MMMKNVDSKSNLALYHSEDSMVFSFVLNMSEWWRHLDFFFQHILKKVMSLLIISTQVITNNQY